MFCFVLFLEISSLLLFFLSRRLAKPSAFFSCVPRSNVMAVFTDVCSLESRHLSLDPV